MSSDADLRKDFERVFSAPPFEFSMRKHGSGDLWPGNYREYHVQCAWEGWIESRRDLQRKHLMEHGHEG